MRRCVLLVGLLVLASLLPVRADNKKLMDQHDLAGIIYTTATRNDPTGTGYDAVVGAEVVIEGTDFKTTSDERGMFFFEEAPEGKVTVVATKEGFGQVKKQADVKKGPMPTMLRMVMNPAGYQMVGNTPVGPGTLYVAFAGRKTDQSQPGPGTGQMSANLQTYRAAIIAGADPLSIATNAPGPLRQPTDFEYNPVTYHANTLMIFPPNAPGNTGFHNLTASPYWLAFNKDGSVLYVSNSNRQIQVIDTRNNNQLLRSLPVQGIVTDLRLSPRGDYVMAAVMAGQPGVMVVDTRTHDPVAYIPIMVQGASQPRAVLMNRESTRLYVVTGTMQGGEMTVVDVLSGQSLGTVQVGANPTGAAMSVDGRYVYVVNSGGGNVTVIDAWSGAPVGDIRVGVTPQRVAVSPDGSRIFVTNKGSNTVTVIDGRSHATLGTVQVGKGPLDVAVTPDSSKAFVTCKDDGTVVMLDAVSGAVEHTTDPMPLSSPYGVAIRP